MWYAIIGMGVFMICLLISLLCLRSDVELIKNRRCSLDGDCEAYINQIMRRSDYERTPIPEEIRETIRQKEEICRIQSNLDKQMRNNTRFGIFKERDVTIKEALIMLYEYLGLKIKPGDDIKIVKSKK